MVADRGDRARIIRVGLGLDQAQMAERLNVEVGRLGHRGRYDRTAISKLENGRRDLSLDDAVVYAAVDPARRGIGWLATGAREVMGATTPGSVANRRGRPATARELGLDTETPASKKKAGGKH